MEARAEPWRELAPRALERHNLPVPISAEAADELACAHSELRVETCRTATERVQ